MQNQFFFRRISSRIGRGGSSCKPTPCARLACAAAILLLTAGAVAYGAEGPSPARGAMSSASGPSRSAPGANLATTKTPAVAQLPHDASVIWDDPFAAGQEAEILHPSPQPDPAPHFWPGPADACPDVCWRPFDDRLWVHGEYLLWWTDEAEAPPLATTSPAGVGVDTAGVLGQPGTTVLFGDEALGGAGHSGGRIRFGWWLDPFQCDGVEASYLGLGCRTDEFRADSAATPILARPYFDAQAGNEAALLVAFPNLIRGSLAVDFSSELQSAEALWRRRMFTNRVSRLDFLLGYRFARLDETLRVDQFSEWIAAQGVIIPGTTRTAFDLFDADNEFHGAEFGVAHHLRHGCWTLDLTMKLALGSTQATVVIDGATQTTVPGAGTANFVGGLLAQPTNIGRYENDEFTVIPELGATLGYEIACRLRATVGYTFFYWSQAARPTDQIDRNVSQLPPEPPAGAQRPEFRFTPNDFWAQGLRLGLEYQF